MAWTFLWSDWVKYFQCPHGWSPAISWAHLPPRLSSPGRLWLLRGARCDSFVSFENLSVNDFHGWPTPDYQNIYLNCHNILKHSPIKSLQLWNVKSRNSLFKWHSKTGIKDASWSGSFIWMQACRQRFCSCEELYILALLARRHLILKLNKNSRYGYIIEVRCTLSWCSSVE